MPLDISGLPQLLEQKGVTARGLSRQMGRPDNHVHRLLKGQRSGLYEDLEQIAVLLKEPFARFVTGSGDSSLTCHRWDAEDTMDRYLSELRGSHSCILFAERMVSSLLPDAIWEWVWTSWKRPPNQVDGDGATDMHFQLWKNHSRTAMELQRKARRDYGFDQLVVAPEQLFRDIRYANEGGAEWLKQIRQVWRTEETTRVALVPQLHEGSQRSYGWAGLVTDIGKILDDNCIYHGGGIEFLSIIDETFLAVRANATSYLFSYDRRRIANIRQRIEVLLQDVVLCWKLAKVNAKTNCTLDRMAMN